MGKLKKAGVNEKAVDARVAKETAKASKQDKEAKQKEDADWAAAGEGGVPGAIGKAQHHAHLTAAVYSAHTHLLHAGCACM